VVVSGEDADPRMSAAAASRGVILTSKSRPLQPEDLSKFDYIVGMDPKNLRAMKVRRTPLCPINSAGAVTAPYNSRHDYLDRAEFL
jgi:protein-tyrosine-phosphatase